MEKEKRKKIKEEIFRSRFLKKIQLKNITVSDCSS
jgi:DNA-binding protein